MTEVAMCPHSAAEQFVLCVIKASALVVEMRNPGDDIRYVSDVENRSTLVAASRQLRFMFKAHERNTQVTIPNKRLVKWDCRKKQTPAVFLDSCGFVDLAC